MAIINLDLHYITLFWQLKFWAVFGRVFVSFWAGNHPSYLATLCAYMANWQCLLGMCGSSPEVPNHRVATHYRAVEEFLPGREKVLGKMCIDMMLC